MNKYDYIGIIRLVFDGVVDEDKNNNIPFTLTYFDNLYSQIIDSIKHVSRISRLPDIDEEIWKKYFEIVKNDYLHRNPICIEVCSTLTKDDFKTWLAEDKTNEIEWNYTERYLKYLKNAGRSEIVINETQSSSKTILERLGDPKSTNSFYVKGLVVGSVQSGKTGNFNAVINRATDCGYRMIIVLSGLYDDLRKQTQLRIENDVIGNGVKDIEKGTKGVVGVGAISGFTSNINVQSITSYFSDFTKSLVDADFNPYAQTNILVCKKNTSVLRNLLNWLHDYLRDNETKHNMPLLILDDEADNASLNNCGAKGREYASKINGHIRALLDMFDKKTYLGYTATPFANVLQDRNESPKNHWEVPYKYKGQKIVKKFTQVDNLFPDDFIVLLNTPSNYIGAKEIFETVKPIENKAEKKLPLIKIVNDDDYEFPTRVYRSDCTPVKDYKTKEDFEHNGGYDLFQDYKTYTEQTRASIADDPFPKKLPRLLKESILCFIISVAVRESRKSLMHDSALYNPHNTMLIHISRFTKWQNKTQKLVKAYINDIKAEIENGDHSSGIFTLLQDIWTKYFAEIIGNIHDYIPENYNDPFLVPISFESLKKRFIVDAVSGIDIKAINSITKETLDYPKLNPKKYIAIGGNRLSRGFTLEGLSINYFIRTTSYSDTLLQMGRWFGYRPGYLDCCKLFTTSDSVERFDTTTLVIEELENEFRKMESANPKKTPRNFELRVRKHPGALKITRPSILKNTKEVKWSYQDQLEMTTKFEVTKQKIENVWANFKRELVPNFQNGIITGSMLHYNTDIDGIVSILKCENNFDNVTCDCIVRFLEICKEKKKLRNWTVALKITGNASISEGKGILSKSETGLLTDIKMAVRKGPDKDPYKYLLLTNKVFHPTGKSANIMTSPRDFALLLTEDQIKIAEENFIENKIHDKIKKNPKLTREEARQEIKTIPERVYRECYSDQEGILVIYLFDSYYSFLQQKGCEDHDLKKFVNDNQIDLNIPLIGYAIGFPPIEDDIGGIYVQGDYDLSIDENSEELNGDSENSDLPDDFTEGIYAD